ncbi:MAG: hypothetical protein H7138_09290 [Myxococcales bacterium]|nr:hypothetical protein [Myxococcales bacterium]
MVISATSAVTAPQIALAIRAPDGRGAFRWPTREIANAPPQSKNVSHAALGVETGPANGISSHGKKVQSMPSAAAMVSIDL